MWAFMSPTELPCPHCQLNAFLNINLFLFNVVGNKIIFKKKKKKNDMRTLSTAGMSEVYETIT